MASTIVSYVIDAVATLTTEQRVVLISVVVTVLSIHAALAFFQFFTWAARPETNAVGGGTATSDRGSQFVVKKTTHEGDTAALVPFVSGQIVASSPAQEQEFAASGHAPFVHQRLSASDSLVRARRFRALADQRRTLRFFSPDPVSEDVMRECIAAAGTAPSGAHQQPWRFVLVRSDTVKQQIRTLVEREEQRNYDRRMKKTWVKDVTHLVDALHGHVGTDHDAATTTVTKPYLTEAPYLIVVFKITKMFDVTGDKLEVYYPIHGVGIATGMLVAALNDANLVTLTSTPMGAEREIAQLCGRPAHEKVFLLMPVGYPAADATVPYRTAADRRKPLDEILSVV